MRGDTAAAAARLSAACSTNPRAVAGLFLLGYVRWKQGQAPAARDLLTRARAALGPDWKPQGATAEGDVTHRAYSETTPLAAYVAQWNGGAEPSAAYAALDRALRRVGRGATE
jgi:hypothetical protein